MDLSLYSDSSYLISNQFNFILLLVMAYYVYIIQSLKDSKYYIGSTSNVEARLKYHNAGKQRSTKNRIPFELVLVEEYKSKNEALTREKMIKAYKGGNAFKKLINEVQPRHPAGRYSRDVEVGSSNLPTPTNEFEV